MFCREHVVQLHHSIDAIHATGAELVVIGSGTPNFVAGFREVTGYAGPILCDPQLSSYAAAKLRRGMWRNFTPLSMVHGVRALARGNMQARTQGDASQQGGVMVIMPPDRVVYTHTSKVAGDNAPPSEILEALGAATRATA